MLLNYFSKNHFKTVYYKKYLRFYTQVQEYLDKFALEYKIILAFY